MQQLTPRERKILRNAIGYNASNILSALNSAYSEQDGKEFKLMTGATMKQAEKAMQKFINTLGV